MTISTVIQPIRVSPTANAARGPIARRRAVTAAATIGPRPTKVNSKSPGTRKEWKGVPANMRSGTPSRWPSGARMNWIPPNRAPMPRKISRTIASRPSVGRRRGVAAGRRGGAGRRGEPAGSCRPHLVLLGRLDSLDYDAAVGPQRRDGADRCQPRGENGAGKPDGQPEVHD